jgi:hypothetical protein
MMSAKRQHQRFLQVGYKQAKELKIRPIQRTVGIKSLNTRLDWPICDF